jgi:hypothetical protein
MSRELLEEIKEDLKKMRLDVFCSTKTVDIIIEKIEEELANPEPKSLTVEQINNMIANNILYGKSDFSIIDLIKEVEKHHGIGVVK